MQTFMDTSYRLCKDHTDDVVACQFSVFYGRSFNLSVFIFLHHDALENHRFKKIAGSTMLGSLCLLPPFCNTHTEASLESHFPHCLALENKHTFSNNSNIPHLCEPLKTKANFLCK